MIDDIEGEAKECRQKGNGWFAYTPEVHLVREAGCALRLFDLVDEKVVLL